MVKAPKIIQYMFLCLFHLLVMQPMFELSLMDQSGKGRHKVHTHFGRVLDAGPYTLKYRGIMWLVYMLCIVNVIFHFV